MRYYDPEKVELLGRSADTEEFSTYLGLYSLWIPVLVLADGDRYIAIEILNGDDLRKATELRLSGNFPYARYYRLPFKFLELFYE